MSGELSIADQRDRFLAFAFAASDVLIEVDDSGTVVFVAGSVKSLFGLSPDQLMNGDVARIADQGDRVLLGEYLKKLIATGRASDRLITAAAEADGRKLQISVSGMSSPQRKGIHHLAVKRVPLASRPAQKQAPANPMGVLDFANSAAMLSGEARDAGEKLNFAMYDVGWEKVESQVDSTTAETLNENLVQTLRAWASGGSGVGQVGQGKYSLLLDEGIDPEVLKKRIADVARETDDKLDLDVNHAALDVNDVIDTDDFGAFFEQAMERFDAVGGEKFDLMSFSELPGSKPQKPEVPPPSDIHPARRMARRKGTTESWG
ncbi:MAG: PAS domain-containing protein [Alphaproteobacteria bacterium]|nr:PAS domain-containing protein [Alphaproteobacteria bacterium]